MMAFFSFKDAVYIFWVETRFTRACLTACSYRPFIKLKENGRANISRSSSSTSSFSSTAGEGEAIEECDSGVGVALSDPGEQGGAPWAQPDTARS